MELNRNINGLEFFIAIDAYWVFEFPLYLILYPYLNPSEEGQSICSSKVCECDCDSNVTWKHSISTVFNYECTEHANLPSLVNPFLKQCSSENFKWTYMYLMDSFDACSLGG